MNSSIDLYRSALKSSAKLMFAFTVLLVSANILGAQRSQSNSSTSAQSELKRFAGTWTAMQKGSTLLVLDLRLANGKMAGDIRTSSFTVDTEGIGEITEVTDATLTKPLPARNFSVSGKSLTFDWADPDGDEVHWKFDLNESGTGSLRWVQLPNGLKMLPVTVTKQPKNGAARHFYEAPAEPTDSDERDYALEFISPFAEQPQSNFC